MLREGKTNGGNFNLSAPKTRKKKYDEIYDEFTLGVFRRRVHRFKPEELPLNRNFNIGLQAELYELVKKHRPTPVYHQTDQLAQKYGHVVMCTPGVRHCELKAIELAWAQVKGYVAKYNTNFNIKGSQLDAFSP